MPTSDKSPRTNKISIFQSYRFYIFLLLLFSLLYFIQPSGTEEISWMQFKREILPAHDVAKIEIVNNEVAEIYLKPDRLKKENYKHLEQKKIFNSSTGPHYKLNIGSVENFEKQLDEAQKNFKEEEKIDIVYTKRRNWVPDLVSWILPFVLLYFLWFYILRGAISRNKNIFDFAKSKPQLYEKGTYSAVTFKDVAGYDEAKAEIIEIVEFLKHPEHYTHLGAKIPKGVLLIGAPGTGKTLMAKAVAGEAGVPFFSLSGSEFVEMFVGVGASRVRDLFNQAKEKAPSIIFIDEIDTVGRMRGKAFSFQANDERESTLNQLLAELDGFDPNTGVIVLAATNRADILDAALLRPGRFDRHIYLELPNKKERIDIFKVHLRKLVLSPSVHPEYLAAQTAGFSGADIANVCNEAALIAARQQKNSIEPEDFLSAIDRIVAGLEKKSKVISPAEKKIVAYHEAGHGLISWKLKNIDPLQKISIIPRGKSLGSAWYIPSERSVLTQSQLFDMLCAALGGRVAEELVLGQASSGALDDLEKATRQAYTMIAHLGLNNKVGAVSFYDSSGNYGSFQKPYSEATAQLIDEEVRKLIKQAYDFCHDLLQQNRNQLDEMANLLIQKETIYKDEIAEILGQRTE